MKPNICPQAHRSVNAVRVLEASVAGLGSGTGNLPSGMLAKGSRQTWSDCFGGQKTCLPGSMERSPPPSCAVPAQLQLCYGFKPTWSRCTLTAGAQQCGILYLKSPANIVKNDTHLLLDSRAFCTQLIRLNWNLFFFPSFLFFHPRSYPSDSFQSGLWELRVFPLKDEEVEALLCQDQVTNQTEMSSAAFPSDSLCTSCTPIGLADNGHPPRKQSTEESEDCENVCLGINNTRKQRWQGIMWFIKKAN